MGYISGNFICCTYDDCSLVDYAAPSAHMHCKIATFRVPNFTANLIIVQKLFLVKFFP